MEHEGHVGQLLKQLDDLGIADNTILVFSTDNGAEVFTGPDGGMTPFRGTKGTAYEGGFRVPAAGPAKFLPARSRTALFQISTGSRPSWRRPETPISSMS